MTPSAHLRVAVYWLSRSAFNALLKTLEEPPDHVIFIMATTELAKVPVTVLSRCQRYDFRRIPVDEIIAHLKAIGQREGINASDDALMVIAVQADGGMRDAQGMLEHLTACTSGLITVEVVEGMLGLVGRSTMHDLLTSLVAGRRHHARRHRQGVPVRPGPDPGVPRPAGELQEHDGAQGRLCRPAPAREEKAFLEGLVRVPFEELHRIVSVLIAAEESLKFSSLPKITLRRFCCGSCPPRASWTSSR